MKKMFLSLSAVCTIFLVMVVSVGTSSCEKETIIKDTSTCPTPTYPVTGLWEGTYQTNQVTHVPTYASMTIFPDGTIIRRNKVVGVNEYTHAKGRWTLSGNTFQYRDTTLIYTGGAVVETGTLTFKDDGTFSNGTWQNIAGQTYTGTYQNMKRIN